MLWRRSFALDGLSQRALEPSGLERGGCERRVPEELSQRHLIAETWRICHELGFKKRDRFFV